MCAIIISIEIRRRPRESSNERRDSLLLEMSEETDVRDRVRELQAHEYRAPQQYLLRFELPLAQPLRNLYSFSFSARPSLPPEFLSLRGLHTRARARVRVLAREMHYLP